MSTKESILSRYKKHIREQFDMPSLDDIKGITYPDPLVQFIKMSESVGGQVIEVAEGRDINTLIRNSIPMPRRSLRTCQRSRLPPGIPTPSRVHRP
jgi:L-lactate dehydrogenase complex protein LldG